MHELLPRLLELDVKLWVQDERIRFEAPEGVMTTSLKEEIVKHKGQLLAYLKNRTDLPVSRPAKLPLSHAQRQLWFVEQVSPGLSNMFQALRFPVPDLEILETALQRLVDRHEILRTTFAADDSDWHQVIAPALKIRVPAVDLSHLSPDEQRTEAQRMAEAEARQFFDLARGPLLACKVLHLTGQDILLLTVHHIVSDGWSMGILADELRLQVRALQAGLQPVLPTLSCQFADFALWQKDWMRNGSMNKQLDFWRENLLGAPPFTDLPSDHVRPAIPSYRGARLMLLLSAGLMNRFAAHCREAGSTLFMGLVAAFKVLLFRYGGVTDIVIGTPTSGRHNEQWRTVLGPLANNVVLRTRLAGETKLDGLLAQIGETCVDAFENQDLPFEKLVEELSPPRDIGRNPIFQILFLFHTTQQDRLDSSFDMKERPFQFDLLLSLQESPEGISGFLEYNTDLFERQTMELLAELYRGILEIWVENPSADLSTISLPKPLEERIEAARQREHRQLLAISSSFQSELLEDSLAFWAKETRWPVRIESAPLGQVFQQLLDPSSLLSRNRDGYNLVLFRFEDWLREESASVPVEETLERLLKDLENALLGLPIQVNTLVMVCQPSPAFLSGREDLLSSLEERLKNDMEALGHVQILTSGELKRLYPMERFYDDHTEKLAYIPYTQEMFAAMGTLFARKIHAWKRAPYKVIVLDCDNTLWNGVAGEVGTSGVRLDAPWLALQEFMSRQQREGKLLCLCSKNEEADVWPVFDRPDMILRKDQFVAWRINWLPKSENLKALARELNLGLDSFIFVDDNPLERAEVRAGCPEVRVVDWPESEADIAPNLAHEWAFDQIKTTSEDRNRTRLYQENSARARLESESLTFETFLAQLGLEVEIEEGREQHVPRVSELTQRTNQFNTTTLRQSEAEVAARKYHIAKVRDRFGDYGLVGVMFHSPGGESLEVDSLMLSCRALGRGVEERLMVWLGSEARRQGFDRVDIRYLATKKNSPVLDFLRAIGERFGHQTEGGLVFRYPVETLLNLEGVVLRTRRTEEPALMPLIPAGERISETGAAVFGPIPRALRTPREIFAAIQTAKPRGSRRGEYVPPRDEDERALAKIWEEVLHQEKVGAKDNFFELGGHSLLATQLVSRVRQEFGVELPLQVIFHAPTLADFAQRISSGRPRKLSPITVLPRPKNIPLSFSQQRLWFIHQLSPGTTAYNICLALRLTGPLDPAALRQGLRRVVSRHEALRTTFHSMDGEPFQQVAETLELPWDHLDLSHLAEPEEELRRQSQEETRTPFDLEKGPLLRCRLLRLADERNVLLLTMHHIVSDGWSMGVLAKEILLFGQAWSTGKDPVLNPLPLQYPDFALWQRTWLQDEVLREQVDFWKTQLEGAPAFLDLPTDHPRPETQSYCGDRLPFSWEASFHEALQNLARKAGATPFMILLAGFQAFLSRWSGQSDVVVGSPIANRRRPELESQIGIFANTLALRTDLSDDPEVPEILRRVKKTCLEAYEHQDLPFEKLVDELKVVRDGSRNPVFQVMFALVGNPLENLPLGALRAEPLAVEQEVALFDLRVSLFETPEGIAGFWEYNTDLFEGETIRHGLETYRRLLETWLRETKTRLSDLQLPVALRERCLAARRRDRPRLVTVASTFTAEPLEDPFSYWMREWKIPSRMVFAPFNQIFQQVLDPSSDLSRNREGFNWLLVRLADWLDGGDPLTDLKGKLDDLVKALAARTTVAPTTVLFCPSFPAAAGRPGEVFSTLESRFKEQAETLGGVKVWTSVEWTARYPVDDTYDPHTDALGGIPYTPAFFAAMGTLLARGMREDPETLPETGEGWDPERLVDQVAASRPKNGKQGRFIHPRTPMEIGLASIWKRVIGLDRVGSHDDFFELGGHSLLATQVASRVRQEWGIEMPLQLFFQVPTLEGMAARLSTMEKKGTLPLMTMPRPERLPLSFAQQRLWFIQQMDPQNTAYNIAVGLRLSGELDAVRLERGLSEVVKRHESLRTIFPMVDGTPIQIVLPTVEPTWNRQDLTGFSSSDQEKEVHRVARREAATPFSLETAPLLRCALLKLAPHDHVLLLTVHHIVSDGWSMGVLAREIVLLSQAGALPTAQVLPDLPLQYPDFAVWQRQWLTGPVLLQQTDYWRRQLSGIPAALELPTDRPRPLVQTHRGGRFQWSPGPELTRSLLSLGRSEGTTLFMTVLAGFQTLLARYSGQTDIIVGSPIANRRHPDLESLIGNFVNTLALRTDLSGAPSFAELLQRVRTTCLEAFDHQDLPFERLVDELQVTRDLSRSPIFQVMFTLQNSPIQPLAVGDLEVSALALDQLSVPFDLSLSLHQEEDGLSGFFEYNADLFDEQTIRAMASHFGTLLASCAAAPHRPIAEHEILTEPERRFLLEECHPPVTEYPRDLTVHQLLRLQSAKTPDSVALRSAGRSMTYRELEEQSNRLAWHLRALGLGPNKPAALCLERNLDMVVGLLGILKAGGFYLPLDPTHPRERLSIILEDAAAGYDDGILLITQQGLSSMFEGRKGPVVCLDRDHELIRSQSHQPCPDETGPRNLAYTIYTSGSTGRPKGVQIPHGAVVNFLSSMAREPGLGPQDVLVSVTTISFDIAGLELYLPLSVGAQVVIAPENQVSDGTRLARLLKDSRATVMQATPSLWRLLLDSGWEGRQEMKALCGGETMPPALAERLRTMVAEIWNLYGPTETTIWSSLHRVDRTEAVIPIGKPIGNTRVYILDRDLRPVPRGVVGELCIAGEGVAAGYLHRPELTLEKFIPDPFSSTPGARMYRTGDLARWRVDGVLECLGRLDYQVKIRGYRIETGEIEAVLSRHDAVADCVVVAREGPGGTKQLAAYLVLHSQESPDAGEWRVFLKDKLPEYMVPSYFMILESLPQTPNGKIDRKALRDTPLLLPQEKASFIAPRTTDEVRLAAIWSQVLDQERIGAGDHFFELGGHSLLAAQVVSRLRQQFSLELPLRTFFQHPTLSDMAAQLSRLRTTTVPPLVPGPRPDRLPLSFPQQRLWFIEQLAPGNTAYNLTLAVRLEGGLEISALKEGLNQVVARHESLRTTFRNVDGEACQIVAASASLRLVEIDLQALAPEQRHEEIIRLIRLETARPFDLENGPLLRSTLIRLSASEHNLVLAMHHIISDAWSLSVLAREIVLLGQAHAAGSSPGLAPIHLQYPDFALWQRQWLQGEILQNQLSYWRTQLSGIPLSLDLPYDHPRPAILGNEGGRVGLTVPPTLTESLSTLGRQEGATLFMVILSAFVAILSRYAGQEDLVVGTPVANRTRRELEDLIGVFINTLALRADLTGDPTFVDLLQRMKVVCWEAYEHQDLPFEVLVDELALPRDLSRSPVFQTLFVLQNAPMAPLEISGLTLSPLEIPGASAQFDLLLSLTEMDGGLKGYLEYNADLFETSTIERLAGHLLRFLEGIAAHPRQKISRLPLLTGTEREGLVRLSRGEVLPEQADSSILTLLGAQVEASPDAVALDFQGQTMSYGELNRRANCWAHHLISLGAGPGVLVGLSAERSFDMVVGLLAILKAGSAYLPLDPHYPPERLAYMISDSGLDLFLTQRHLVEYLPARKGLTLCLDGPEADGVAALPTVDPAAHPLAEHPAYVIYTSGSTGRPKGVVVPHRGIANLALEQIRSFQVDRDSRVLQFAPFSFDASVSEIFMTLAAGARLCLASLEKLRPGRELVQLCSEMQVTVVTLPPSALALMSPQDLKGVKSLIVAGEACPLELARPWAEGRHFCNAYGPTETTVCATIARGVSQEEERMTIGRPIANTRTYVLDEGLQPVPFGVAGELHIGGLGLALGYLNQPELTSSRFIVDPFCDPPGAFMYKSGDLVRLRSDGNLEFLSRLDQQVKVRGHRIELGEIEACLHQIPDVLQAVVVLREDRPGDRRLVAYVVPEKAPGPSPMELRSRLKARLPEYMLPHVFLLVEKMPTTPNGKIDRKSLPAPDPQTRQVTAALVAPRTPMEQTLAEIWKDLLRIDRIGVFDNFFEVGGDSLLAIQLIFRVGQAFEVEVPLQAVFLEAPHIAGMAEILNRILIEQADAQDLEKALSDLDQLSDEQILALLEKEKNL